MKTYIGTKIIQASPQKEEEAFPDKFTDSSQGPGRDGYRVVYEDGYTSWSPADVFEAAYVEVPEDDAPLFLDALRDRLEALKNGALLHEAMDAEADQRGTMLRREEALRLAVGLASSHLIHRPDIPGNIVLTANMLADFTINGTLPPFDELTSCDVEKLAGVVGERVDGEGLYDAILRRLISPITRDEIERRGFDTEEGADQTILGIMAKLGFPSTAEPLGTEPTHRLVPINDPAANEGEFTGASTPLYQLSGPDLDDIRTVLDSVANSGGPQASLAVLGLKHIADARRYRDEPIREAAQRAG